MTPTDQEILDDEKYPIIHLPGRVVGEMLVVETAVKVLEQRTEPDGTIVITNVEPISITIAHPPELA